VRRDKIIQEHTHDPYFNKTALSDPSICKACGVVYTQGNFKWKAVPPEHAQSMECPACRRIRDHYEGGIVHIGGTFTKEHKDELLNLVANVETTEKTTRPLERLVEISQDANAIVIKTTYEHLARRIGEALHRAYKGELRLTYPDGEKYVRIHWFRDT